MFSSLTTIHAHAILPHAANFVSMKLTGRRAHGASRCRAFCCATCRCHRCGRTAGRCCDWCRSGSYQKQIASKFSYFLLQIFSLSLSPTLSLDLECIPFNSHNSHTMSEFNLARIEQCHDYRPRFTAVNNQSAIESAKHCHVSNLSSC
jgi:hypothetical protein